MMLFACLVGYGYNILGKVVGGCWEKKWVMSYERPLPAITTTTYSAAPASTTRTTMSGFQIPLAMIIIGNYIDNIHLQCIHTNHCQQHITSDITMPLCATKMNLIEYVMQCFSLRMNGLTSQMMLPQMQVRQKV